MALPLHLIAPYQCRNHLRISASMQLQSVRLSTRTVLIMHRVNIICVRTNAVMQSMPSVHTERVVLFQVLDFPFLCARISPRL